MIPARIKVADIELSAPPPTIEGLRSYASLQGLVRLHGTPIGWVRLPVVGELCPAPALRAAILAQLHKPLVRRLLIEALRGPLPPDGWRLAELLAAPAAVAPMPPGGAWPLVTVAVCTRDRPTDLACCLDALVHLRYPALDLLVVDNAPCDDATERLVQTRFPQVRYVREPRPGLDWARNRAIREAQGALLAYTDDDVIVDPGWVEALARVFVEQPEVMAVTGLVVPHELETDAQILFERYGGFGRGFVRRWFRADRVGGRPRRFYLGAGQFGTGANMAYRRELFARIGGFDPALDVGTVTNGGGDLEMFFRVLKEGHTLVYEPGAVVRHRHRPDYAQLRTQLANNGIGFYSYLVRSALHYPDERLACLRLGVWWLGWWNIRRLLLACTRPAYFPHDLILAELLGSLVGLTRYWPARRAAAHIARAHPPAMPVVAPRECATRPAPRTPTGVPAVRVIDLVRPPGALDDLANHDSVRVVVTRDSRALGEVRITNAGGPVNAARLREAIIDGLPAAPLAADHEAGLDALWEGAAPLVSAELPPALPVSIVVATRDRPADLRDCLRQLVAQASSRPVEIIVVDNNPTSGLTPPVAAEFTGVALVSEPRRGLSRARNRGILASSGAIVVTVDDDIVPPPDWLERLIAPFARAEVMIVTGDVRPLELATDAQRLFEAYGGLGRGRRPFEVDAAWLMAFHLRAAPTWRLGATANAAFRASIFGDPRVGLLDEALGAGTPTGCSEDTYLFYRTLKAGGTLVYEPAAYVWHRHRRDLPALRRQIYNYSKGHVAYHLTTLIRDRDARGLADLAIRLPATHLRRAIGWLGGKGNYPPSLIALEVAGNLAGPWALWRSLRHVAYEGRRTPDVTRGQHPEAAREWPCTGRGVL